MPVGIYKRQKRVINCKICGKETTVYSSAGKFCKECYEAKSKKEHRDYNRRVKREKRLARGLKCEKCGADIGKFPKAKKYCPDCRESVALEQRREHYKKNREKYLEYSREYYSKPENKEKHRQHARAHYEKKRIDNLP